MDTIVIQDLEVSYCVGVTEVERARPQRLWLTLEIGQDLKAAAAADDLKLTIDYYAVCQRLLRLGEARSWKLLETLAAEIASIVLTEFMAASVAVEVKKFIIPEARYVSVRLART